MERKVSVYPFPFGTRVFMHRNGVIREAEYRGMRIKDTGICGNNVDTEHIFWFGSKLGEEKFKVSMPIYKTAEDYAFKVATAYFREQGKVPVFEDSNCRLIKL